MSEELPETADGAIRGFVALFVLGAVLEGWSALHHDEIIRALKYWGVGAMLSAIGVFWTRIRTLAGPRFSATASHVATDFRWWVVAVIFILSLLTLSPFVEQERWPFSLEPITLLGAGALLLVIGSIIGATAFGKRSHIPFAAVPSPVDIAQNSDPSIVETPNISLHMALHVGHFWADFTQIKQHLRFSISLVLFNQTDQDIVIDGVQGNLTFENFSMAAVSLENMPLTAVAHQHDGVTITIWQSVTNEEKDRICEAMLGAQLIFNFTLIRLLVHEHGRTFEPIKLHNFDGIACRNPKEGDVICNRTVALCARGRI